MKRLIRMFLGVKGCLEGRGGRKSCAGVDPARGDAVGFSATRDDLKLVRSGGRTEGARPFSRSSIPALP